MHPTSRELLHENPVDWTVSKNRLLRAALLNGDQEVVDQIVDDVAHVVGKINAELWMITTMGEMVAKDLDGKHGQTSSTSDENF